jgi:protein-S-isoprenylcysteine O-methyltransferase Ste14
MSNITIATLRQTLLARADSAPAMRVYIVMNIVLLLVAMVIAPRAMDRLSLVPVNAAHGALVVVIGLAALLRLAQVRITAGGHGPLIDLS